MTYDQVFDAENRLVSVTTGGQTTQFVYDGDGNLVKKTNPNGSKTIYAAGGLYEVDKDSGGSVTRTVTYYPAGGAMRIDNTMYYNLKDHLGSASVATDSSGAVVGEQRYYPFGETRLSTGSMFTDKLFTGQREMTGLGIYHYGARYYSPKLGLFLSADSIVPGASNPQAFNRYSYVLNNPLRYTDPTGHMQADFGGGGGTKPKYVRPALPKRPTTPPPTKPTTPTPILTPMPTKTPVIMPGSPATSGVTSIPTLTPTPTTPASTVIASSIVLPTPGGGTPYAHTLYPPRPLPPIDLPSGVDIVNFLWEPGPVGDQNFVDIMGAGLDTSPVFPVPYVGAVPNPLYGSGRSIAQGINAVGLSIYLVVNYGELPAWGTPPPIISTPNLYTPMPISPPTPETGTPYAP